MSNLSLAASSYSYTIGSDMNDTTSIDKETVNSSNSNKMNTTQTKKQRKKGSAKLCRYPRPNKKIKGDGASSKSSSSTSHQEYKIKRNEAESDKQFLQDYKTVTKL